MVLKEWSRSNVKSGVIFTPKKYKPFDVYVYKKGWFGKAMNSYVVKINHRENHADDEFYYFSSMNEAMAYAIDFIKVH